LATFCVTWILLKPYCFLIGYVSDIDSHPIQFRCISDTPHGVSDYFNLVKLTNKSGFCPRYAVTWSSYALGPSEVHNRAHVHCCIGAANGLKLLLVNLSKIPCRSGNQTQEAPLLNSGAVTVPLFFCKSYTFSFCNLFRKLLHRLPIFYYFDAIFLVYIYRTRLRYFAKNMVLCALRSIINFKLEMTDPPFNLISISKSINKPNFIFFRICLVFFG
jgi:hypothetical protein